MSTLNTWGVVFSQSLIGLWAGFIHFLPGLIGATILFFLGWIIGVIVGKATAQVIDALKIDKLFKSAGTDRFMERAGFHLNIGKFTGELVKWFIIIVFLIASLQIVGLTQVNDFLKEAVLYYLPKVIVASLVLVIATVLADAMYKLIKGSAKAMRVRSANMLASVTRYAIWIFAFIIALSELGIATAFMQILFTGFVAALAISLGLAFGLGGKEAAGRAIDHFEDEFSIRK